MALRRIEEAIARIEAAARNPVRPDSLGAAPEFAEPKFAEIEATNARLREAVAMSLRQIDALIAQHGVDGPR
jgi:hypothetical protein